MKLLHTSDWHLGARLGRHDRLPDHLAALRSLLATAEEQEPDLIIHSGDLFDSTRPAYQPLQAGIKALRRLAEVAPTVVLAGNHDSGQLLRIIDELAQMSGTGRLQLVTRPGVVTVDGLEDVAIAAVPFVTPATVVEYASEQIDRLEGTYADQVRALNDTLIGQAEQQAGTGGIVLYTAHLHVHGARPGRSERRMTVGEDYATHVEGLHRALYCALGHIHDPQMLPGGQVAGRYAGSLIPIDFGEATQDKHSVLADLDGATPTVDELPLAVGRPLRHFSGTVEEFAAAAEDGGFDGAILKARVVSDDPHTDLADLLAERSPDCAVFDLTNEVTNRPVTAVKPREGEDDGEPPLSELFAVWQASPARGATAPMAQVANTLTAALDAPDDATSTLVGDIARRVGAALEALPAADTEQELP